MSDVWSTEIGYVVRSCLLTRIYTALCPPPSHRQNSTCLWHYSCGPSIACSVSTGKTSLSHEPSAHALACLSYFGWFGFVSMFIMRTRAYFLAWFHYNAMPCTPRVRAPPRPGAVSSAIACSVCARSPMTPCCSKSHVPADGCARASHACRVCRPPRARRHDPRLSTRRFLTLVCNACN